jgi:soluble lytic murein transglycosylase-like protein
VLIAIESKFNKAAKSPIGAVGLSQVMPQFVSDFGRPCSITTTKDDDLFDIETNLLLGACQFRELSKELDNPALALVAYNAGQSAAAIKQMKSQSNIQNIETANYVSKFTYLKSEAESNVNKTNYVLKKGKHND